MKWERLDNVKEIDKVSQGTEGYKEEATGRFICAPFYKEEAGKSEEEKERRLNA